jgi:hypothetical protein
MHILKGLSLIRRTLGCYAGEAPPILYIPMLEIFLFYKMGKKRGNKKRVVYVRGGSYTHAFS